MLARAACLAGLLVALSISLPREASAGGGSVFEGQDGGGVGVEASHGSPGSGNGDSEAGGKDHGGNGSPSPSTGATQPPSGFAGQETGTSLQIVLVATAMIAVVLGVVQLIVIVRLRRQVVALSAGGDPSVAGVEGQ